MILPDIGGKSYKTIGVRHSNPNSNIYRIYYLKSSKTGEKLKNLRVSTEENTQGLTVISLSDVNFLHHYDHIVGVLRSRIEELDEQKRKLDHSNTPIKHSDRVRRVRQYKKIRHEYDNKLKSLQRAKLRFPRLMELIDSN